MVEDEQCERARRARACAPGLIASKHGDDCHRGCRERGPAFAQIMLSRRTSSHPLRCLTVISRGHMHYPALSRYRLRGIGGPYPSFSAAVNIWYKVRASLSRLQVFERGDDRDRTYSMQDFPPGAPLRRGGVPFLRFFSTRPFWGIPPPPRPLTLASSLRVGPRGGGGLLRKSFATFITLRYHTRATTHSRLCTHACEHTR